MSPVIGYDKAAAIAHQANDQGTTLREAALASGYINGKDFDRIVDPAAMTGLRQHSEPVVTGQRAALRQWPGARRSQARPRPGPRAPSRILIRSASHESSRRCLASGEDDMEASFMTRTRAAPPAGPGPAAEPRSRAAHGAFERFFREHYPAVVRIAHSVVGDAQAAQDVAQDVFIAALRRFPDQGQPDFDRSGHAAAWVRAAAAHTGLNAIRGERRRNRRQQLSGIEVAPAGPEDAILDRESAAEVRRALARLPRRSATVLVLRHSGLSYAEVADAMNVKVGHVGTMLRRAESALRKELSDEPRQ